MSFWENPVVTYFFVFGYLGVLTFAWGLLLLGVSRWGEEWRVDPPNSEPGEKSPSVSICIPARNEEDNIEDCLRAAQNVHWPNLEIVLVNDRSDDQTGLIAQRLASEDSRIRVIEGVEPPSGWAGKPWACSRAAKEAKGAWLLFVDADVRLHPGAIQAAVQIGKDRDLALVSFFGTWIVQGFWERVLVPAVGWLIRGAVDFEKVNVRSYAEAFANGQFILMRRDAYFAIGGHGAVRDQVLEDVRLAEVVKRNGFGVEVRPADWAFDVRLYDSLTAIINGYTKNLYEGLGRRPSIGFGAALFLFVCALLPFLLLLSIGIGQVFWEWSLVSPWVLLWLLVICGLQIAFRWQQERVDGRSGSIAWAQPLANILLIWILLRSTSSIKVQWKGRTFVDGRAN